MLTTKFVFIALIITVKSPADKYKPGGHSKRCARLLVRYLAPRLNLRFAFLCSFSAASRRLASSTALSAFSGSKARLTRSKSVAVPRRALFSSFTACKPSDNRSLPSRTEQHGLWSVIKSLSKEAGKSRKRPWVRGFRVSGNYSNSQNET